MATTHGATTRSAWGWAIAHRRQLANDVALWVLVSIPVAIEGLAGHRGGASDVLLAGAALGLILIRRRWPIPVLAIALVATVSTTALLGRPTALLPTSVLLLFAVAVRHDRATGIKAGLAGVASLLACVAILVPRRFYGPELLAGLAWPTLAVAAGDGLRSRREAITAAEERADRAEAARDEEARRRVAEERLHIARELHDVVAHQIAVINVQAGVAAHLLRQQPDAAEAALATVRSSARQVLDELSGILGVLRSGPGDDTSTDPVPTLADVPALVASFEGTGLRVTLETSGASRPVADTTAVAAYRIVQEALTNAHKHGAGDARLRLAHHPDRLEITVTNRLPAAVAAGTTAATGATSASAPTAKLSSGFGLIGMRERVNAAGGTLEAGPRPDGTWETRAVLPARAPEAA